MLDERDTEREEDRLRDIIGRLPADQRRAFYERARNRIKDPDTYAALNWFFLAGLHHFYLGRAGRGAVNLFGFVIGLALLFSALFLLGLVLILVILAVELFELARSQAIVRHHNNLETRAILADMGVAEARLPR